MMRFTLYRSSEPLGTHPTQADPLPFFFYPTLYKSLHPDLFLLFSFLFFITTLTHPHSSTQVQSYLPSGLPSPFKVTTFNPSPLSTQPYQQTHTPHIHNELRCPYRPPPVDSRRCPHCPLLLRHGPLCRHHPRPSRCCLQGNV